MLVFYRCFTYCVIRFVFFVCMLPSSQGAIAQDLSQVFKGKETQSARCYYAHMLHMQFAMLNPNSAITPAQMQREAQIWQTLLPRLFQDQVTLNNAVQQAMSELNQEAANYRAQPQNISEKLLAPIIIDCRQLASNIAEYDEQQKQKIDNQKEAERNSRIQLVNQASEQGNTFAHLFDRPLSSKFYWNWYSSVYANVRTNGTITKVADEPLTLRLKFASKITNLCVGELQAIKKVPSDYLVLLKVSQDASQDCEPRVSSGLLYLSSADEDPLNRRMYLRLYDEQKRLVTNGVFTPNDLMHISVDNEKLVAAHSNVMQLEQSYEKEQASIFFNNFKTHPDYLRLAPFYQTCAQQQAYVGETYNVDNQQYMPYCVCLTYKFGVDGRIPEQEYLSYLDDFSKLTSRFGDYSEQNKLYTRLNDTCMSCSSVSEAGAYYCNEADDHLYAPSTYAEMLNIMTKYPEKLSTSRFYMDEFFRTYLQAYSVYCPEKINNPVKFDYIVIEHTTIDPWAGTTSDVIQHTTTYVEPKYASSYQRTYDDYKKLSPAEVVTNFRSQIISNERELRRRQSDIALFVETQINNRVALKEHLLGNCDTAEVNKSYQSLALLEK